MDKRLESLLAVKDAVHGEEFRGRTDVYVLHGGKAYIYEKIYVNVFYNIQYMQMDVELNWDDDTNQPKCATLGLHFGYNSNFQQFTCENGALCWKDGANTISVKFN